VPESVCYAGTQAALDLQAGDGPVLSNLATDGTVAGEEQLVIHLLKALFEHEPLFSPARLADAARRKSLIARMLSSLVALISSSWRMNVGRFQSKRESSSYPGVSPTDTKKALFICPRMTCPLGR
jgi:hypothetical protein